LVYCYSVLAVNITAHINDDAIPVPILKPVENSNKINGLAKMPDADPVRM